MRRAAPPWPTSGTPGGSARGSPTTSPREGMKYEESCTSLAHFRDARRFSERLTNYTPPGGDEV